MPLPRMFHTGRTTILVTPTQVVPFSITDDNSRGVMLKAPGTDDAAPNTAPVDIGRSGVTTSTGFALAPGESVVLPIRDAEDVYAVSSSNQVLMWAIV